MTTNNRKPKRRPLILVSHGHSRQRQLAKAVFDGGGRAVMIGPGQRDNGIAVAKQVDGIILAGGGDIDPSIYGETNIWSRGIDAERDDLEFSLIQTAIDRGIPLLGICRGMQILSVFFGAQLWQEVGEISDWPHQTRSHLIEIEQPSLVRSAVRRKRVEVVNSYHHQAIDEGSLPSYLQVTSRSLVDAIPESIEHASRPLFGVQWHPESLRRPAAYRLFELFVDMVIANG